MSQDENVLNSVVLDLQMAGSNLAEELDDYLARNDIDISLARKTAIKRMVTMKRYFFTKYGGIPDHGLELAWVDGYIIGCLFMLNKPD